MPGQVFFNTVRACHAHHPDSAAVRDPPLAPPRPNPPGVWGVQWGDSAPQGLARGTHTHMNTKAESGSANDNQVS